MSTPIETIKSLATLISTEPAPDAELRNATSAEQYAKIAAASARRHGRAVDEADLQAHFRAQSGQTTHGRPDAAVTDEELAGVAGGGTVIPDLNAPMDPRGNRRVG